MTAANVGAPPDTPGLLAGLQPTVRAAIADYLDHDVLGVPDAAKPAVIAALAAAHRGPVLVLTATPADADDLLERLPIWLDQPQQSRLCQFPARDLVPYDRQPAPADVIEQRLAALNALRHSHPILITDADAVTQPTLGLESSPIRIERGGELRLDALLRALDAAGYQRERLVVTPATFAVRGGIVDLWPVVEQTPVRVELFGDDVDSLRRFDPATQRSTETLDTVEIRPAREWNLRAAAERLSALLEAVDSTPTPPDAHAPDLSAEAVALSLDLERLRLGEQPSRPDFWTPFLAPTTLIEQLPVNTLILIDELHELLARAEERDARAEHARTELEAAGRIPQGLPHPWLTAAQLEVALRATLCEQRQLSRLASGPQRLPFQPVERLAGKLADLFERLRQQGDGPRALISLQAARLSELMADYGIPFEHLTAGESPNGATIAVARAALNEGWRLVDPARQQSRLTLITDTEVFGFTRQRQRRATPRRGARTFDPHLLETLQPGDYVVHVDAGIARFHGVVLEEVAGRTGEYLDLRYAQGDRLLVPSDQLHRVQPYVGPSDQPPTLTRLGTQQWTRAKQRVRGAVIDIAEDLLELHAARETMSGIPIEPDSPWQIELEASFPYIETPDQHQAIEEVRADQEAVKPMDRLIVGDVGYGKTEIAVRAAFKAIMSGHQVAMLVPTTVLTQQHFDTFSERLAAMNVRLALLSRQCTPAEERAVISGLKSGAIDLVIGTHRLIQKDVAFKDLGLVIIDEEQRFGVVHKEALKRLRREVDVLTLTATPIPRSLHQAVTGIRDMSTIATPPEERLPIQTQVMERDDSVIREAILRERDRGGQTYFLHNEVRTIELETRRLRELVPEARFLIAHGQMPPPILRRTMRKFTGGEADVLVCSTIIESGLDIPRVNTIIIDRAERLGLAQLYQLRGRVGRASVRAYAYLMTAPYRSLSETAQRRLAAILDASELGAGFQLALRDLEIRGAGNLLGQQQSGHIGAVGFTLFTQLLAEAVEQAKAKRDRQPPPQPRQGPQVSVDLPLPRYLPTAYIEDLGLRMTIYQRLAGAETPAEVDALERELQDRFGDLPLPAQHLVDSVSIKTQAAQLGAFSIQYEDGAVITRLAPGISFSASQRSIRMPPHVSVGRTQLRYTPTRSLRESPWRKTLSEALKRLREV